MKIIVLAIATLMLAGCSTQPVHITTPPPPPTTVDFPVTVTWQYDFTNFFPCSTTVTKGCINTFSVGYQSGSMQVVLNTAPVTACTGTTQPESCTTSFNTKLPVSPSPGLTWSVVTNFLDVNGNAGSTSAAPGNTTPINASVATNVSATIGTP